MARVPPPIDEDADASVAVPVDGDAGVPAAVEGDAAAPSRDPETIEHWRTEWQMLIDAVNRVDPMFAGVLRSCRPVEAEPGRLVIGARGNFHYDRIRDPEKIRIAELEARLRRIAAELKAAGILHDLDTFPSLSEHPQMAELTNRQREILIRLLSAQRVSVIATELYVTPSTVRNHLLTIFSKFGVHSQAELLAVLRTYR